MNTVNWSVNGGEISVRKPALYQPQNRSPERAAYSGDFLAGGRFHRRRFLNLNFARAARANFPELAGRPDASFAIIPTAGRLRGAMCPIVEFGPLPTINRLYSAWGTHPTFRDWAFRRYNSGSIFGGPRSDS